MVIIDSGLLFGPPVDVLIQKLRKAGFGCGLLNEYCGCLVFADDIRLLSHTLNAMRHRLKICD